MNALVHFLSLLVLGFLCFSFICQRSRLSFLRYALQASYKQRSIHWPLEVLTQSCSALGIPCTVAKGVKLHELRPIPMDLRLLVNLLAKEPIAHIHVASCEKIQITYEKTSSFPEDLNTWQGLLKISVQADEQRTD